MLDLAKLTPAPWVATDYLHEVADFTDPHGNVEEGWQILGDMRDGEGYSVAYGEHVTGFIFPSRTDLEFIALARNAFDVMMRHPEWQLRSCVDGAYTLCWEVYDAYGREIVSDRWYDPFTALVEADRWYAANVEQ